MINFEYTTLNEYELELQKMEYSFNCLKGLFENYGYDLEYEIISKRNECMANQSYLDYLNIIVEIKDKYGNHIFFTDENVFSLKEGEKMVCKKIMNICVGDYDIFGEKFNFRNIGITELENNLETQLKIM
uniref:Uncharacterized protein n=1 Tax=viral metagenome TaxID=1070528 RepID=A0A6C0L3D4_9ZZZZ